MKLHCACCELRLLCQMFSGWRKVKGLGFGWLSSAQLTPFWSFTAKARKELKGEAQKAANAAP